MSDNVTYIHYVSNDGKGLSPLFPAAYDYPPSVGECLNFNQGIYCVISVDIESERVYDGPDYDDAYYRVYITVTLKKVE